MKAFRMFSCERTVNFDHFFVYNTLAYWKRSDLLSIDAISIAMSSSSDEDSDITYNSEESVSEDLREAYQKVRREVYAIRKRRHLGFHINLQYIPKGLACQLQTMQYLASGFVPQDFPQNALDRTFFYLFQIQFTQPKGTESR